MKRTLKLITAAAVVLAPTLGAMPTAQATPLGCASGFLTLGAGAATSMTGAGVPVALLTAGAGTAAIFDQCEMMPEEGVVMEIPPGAVCVDLNQRDRQVPCPAQARVSPLVMEA